MVKSLFSQIEKIASQLQREPMYKTAETGDKSKHPTGKADDGTVEVRGGEQEQWLSEYAEEYLENSPDTLEELEDREDHGELGEGERERSGVEMAFCDDPAEKPKDRPTDDTKHPANAEKAAYIYQVKNASLPQLLDMAIKLTATLVKKSANEKRNQIEFALSALAKSAEDVADLAAVQVRKVQDQDTEDEDVEATDDLELSDEEVAQFEAEGNRIIDATLKALKDHPDIAQDVVSAFIENGVITVEEGEEILNQLQVDGSQLGHFFLGAVPDEELATLDWDQFHRQLQESEASEASAFGNGSANTIELSDEEVAQLEEEGNRIIDATLESLKDHPDIAQKVVSAFVENGVITEEDGEEILRRLQADKAASNKSIKWARRRAHKLAEAKEERKQVIEAIVETLRQYPQLAKEIVTLLVNEGVITQEEADQILQRVGQAGAAVSGADTGELDQVADQVLNALLSGSAGDAASMMAEAPPADMAADEIAKKASEEEILTAAIDAARELGITFAELSQISPEGAVFAKQAAAFQRSGKYKIRTYKEGSHMRKLVDYMKDYFVDLIRKNRN